ncbi:MAG: hypothetical protein ACTS27_01430 [Phycisphaerales bacterium]
MTAPSPAIRCISCGYDVASLIAQRGRDEPGVCPECGASIHESMNVWRGIEWQHRRSVSAYFAFVAGAVRRPTDTALAINRQRSLRDVALIHTLASGASLALAPTPLLLLITFGSTHTKIPTAANLARDVGFLFVCGLAFAITLYLLNRVVLLAADISSRRAISPSARRVASVIGMSWAPLIGPLLIVLLPLGLFCGLAGFAIENLNPLDVLVSALDQLMGQPSQQSQYGLASAFLNIPLLIVVPFVLWRGVRASLRAREALLPVAPA